MTGNKITNIVTSVLLLKLDLRDNRKLHNCSNFGERWQELGIIGSWEVTGTIGKSVLFVRLDMRGDRINYSNFSAFVKIGLERWQEINYSNFSIFGMRGDRKLRVKVTVKIERMETQENSDS